MKILKSLQSVISKLSSEEAGQFHDYLIYKKEKKLLRLFEVLYKLDDSAELEYLMLYLKKKNVHQNLRISSKRLYYLIIDFWNDNPPEVDKNIEIGKLMHGASVFIKRGLLQDALNLYEQAKEVAEAAEKFSCQYEILFFRNYLNNLMAPNKALKLLENINDEAKVIGKKMEVYFSLTVLSSKMHYALYSCKNWAFNKEDELYFDDILKEINRLLLLEECSLRSKYLGHYLLFTANTSLPYGELDQAEYHALESIKFSEILFKEDPNRYRMNVMFNFKGLLNVYFVGKRKEEFGVYLQKFREFMKSYTGKDKNMQYALYEIEFQNCVLNQEYSRAENLIIPQTLSFIKKYKGKIPFSQTWHLYSLCFAVKFSMGKLEDALFYLKQMTENDKQRALQTQLKFQNRLISLLINFELGNFEYVDNTAKSTRRLYSDMLNSNPAGKLLIRYIIKLSKTKDVSKKVLIFKDFKMDLDEVFESFYYRKIVGVNFLSDWVNAKANQVDNIQKLVSL